MSVDSKQITLCTSGNWHFYLKEDNYHFVYLSLYLGHNDVPRGTNITFEAPVEVRIPIDVWRKMVASWQKNEWGKDPKKDNMTFLGKKLLDDFIKSVGKKEK